MRHLFSPWQSILGSIITMVVMFLVAAIVGGSALVGRRLPISDLFLDVDERLDIKPGYFAPTLREVLETRYMYDE